MSHRLSLENVQVSESDNEKPGVIVDNDEKGETSISRMRGHFAAALSNILSIRLILSTIRRHGVHDNPRQPTHSCPNVSLTKETFAHWMPFFLLNSAFRVNGTLPRRKSRAPTCGHVAVT